MSGPKDIYPSNDCNCGVGPLTDHYQALGVGLTITAWLSLQRNHWAGAEAPPIHADLSITLTETSVGVSGEYRGYIDKAKIDQHLYTPNPNHKGKTIWLHRSDPTGYHEAEECFVQPVRRS